MLSLFSLLFLEKQNKSQQLVSEIGSTRYCAPSDMIYHVITPVDTKYLFVITELPDNVTVSYTHPVGSAEQVVDTKYFATIFPNGNAEISFNIPYGKCVSFAYTDMISQGCLTSTHVIVNSSANFDFNISETNADYCLFYAAPGYMRYSINCSLGENKIYYYKEKFDANPTSIYEKDVKLTGNYTKTPILLRLLTGEKIENTRANVKLISRSTQENISYFNGEATKLKNPPVGVLSYTAIIPFVGSFPFVFLVISLILSFIRISKRGKK